jgi:Na+-driven multidrug efflux pump
MAIIVPLEDDQPSEQLIEDVPNINPFADILVLLKFALPTLCIAVTSPLLSLVDTSVVGLKSEAQLAAMAPATAISDGLGYILTFIPMAVTNLVALHMSRKHPASAGATATYLKSGWFCSNCMFVGTPIKLSSVVPKRS